MRHWHGLKHPNKSGGFFATQKERFERVPWQTNINFYSD